MKTLLLLSSLFLLSACLGSTSTTATNTSEALRASAVISGAGTVTECTYGQGCYPVQPQY